MKKLANDGEPNCKGIQGVVEEGEEIIHEEADDDVRDDASFPLPKGRT